jgi:hypothetical protein
MELKKGQYPFAGYRPRRECHEHLKIAAQGADSQVKVSAQQLLQRLGQ